MIRFLLLIARICGKLQTGLGTVQTHLLSAAVQHGWKPSPNAAHVLQRRLAGVAISRQVRADVQVIKRNRKRLRRQERGLA